MEFGQRVTICGTASKVHDGKNTLWERCKSATPQPVMIIGKRVVHEGRIVTERDGDWETGYYEYTYFEHKCSHVVYLVVRNMRENPFYVFPDQIVSEPE